MLLANLAVLRED